MDTLSILKKDGSEESWNKDKLLASLGKAGVDVSGAQNIYDKVFDWVINSQSEGKIKSLDLRDKIIETMREKYPAEADSYQAYKKG